MGKVVWTPEADTRLFLTILATQQITIDYPKVAAAFGATTAAITQRMFKLRQRAKEMEAVGNAAGNAIKTATENGAEAGTGTGSGATTATNHATNHGAATNTCSPATPKKAHMKTSILTPKKVVKMDAPSEDHGVKVANPSQSYTGLFPNPETPGHNVGDSNYREPLTSPPYTPTSAILKAHGGVEPAWTPSSPGVEPGTEPPWRPTSLNMEANGCPDQLWSPASPDMEPESPTMLPNSLPGNVYEANPVKAAITAKGTSSSTGTKRPHSPTPATTPESSNKAGHRAFVSPAKIMKTNTIKPCSPAKIINTSTTKPCSPAKITKTSTIKPCSPAKVIKTSTTEPCSPAQVKKTIIKPATPPKVEKAIGKQFTPIKVPKTAIKPSPPAKIEKIIFEELKPSKVEKIIFEETTPPKVEKTTIKPSPKAKANNITGKGPIQVQVKIPTRKVTTQTQFKNLPAAKLSTAQPSTAAGHQVRSGRVTKPRASPRNANKKISYHDLQDPFISMREEAAMVELGDEIMMDEETVDSDVDFKIDEDSMDIVY